MPKCLSCGHPNPSHPNPSGNERCEKCGALLSSEATGAASQPDGPTEDAEDPIEAEVLKLLQSGKKIAAIKLYRENHPGIGLKEAKDAVEAMAAQHGIVASKGSGCAGALLLMSAAIAGLWWWQSELTVWCDIVV
ncbi:MAG: hypothetical protein V3R99_08065 [Thermoguttaceae bacterium]